MRVWNSYEYRSHDTDTWFWSYLWGFETPTTTAISYPKGLCFGVTYEGLKPIIDNCIYPLNGWFWSYLWGFETGSILLRIYPPAGFGVTYEGLKPANSRYLSYMSGLFWSYLWGLETHLSPLPLMPKLIVLELPMRVWNSQLASTNRIEMPFWSYLWGFETPPRRVAIEMMSSCFGVTYEGLKLISHCMLAVV